MKLTDLNPRFIGTGGEGVCDANGKPAPYRESVGLIFNCPCGCGIESFVAFKNPLDGGLPIYNEQATWQRTGETFDNMTLTPSILRSKEKGGCGWHGFITNGEVTTV